MEGGRGLATKKIYICILRLAVTKSVRYEETTTSISDKRCPTIVLFSFLNVFFCFVRQAS